MSTHELTGTERQGMDRQEPSQRLLQELFDLLPMALLLIEPGTARLVFANPLARREQLGPAATSREFYALDEACQRLAESELPWQRIARGEAFDGARFNWHTPERTATFQVFSRAFSADEQRPPLALLTFVDITHQCLIEEELRRALEARNEFLSVAAHELRDPLFALQLSIQLLRHTAARHGAVPPHIQHHVEVSQRQAERLSRLIDNLLDVARIANKRLRLDVESLDLCTLLHEMVQRFQAQAEANGTALAAESCEPVIGFFDRLKLEQILSNLLSNALKYGAGKPVVVRVRDEEDTALLEVEDHGIGIAPEDQTRVFHRFERVALGHKKDSLGLGLFIVRSLVEAHGGTVRLRSEPGKGSTFTVALPRRACSGQATAGSDHPEKN